MNFEVQTFGEGLHKFITQNLKQSGMTKLLKYIWGNPYLCLELVNKANETNLILIKVNIFGIINFVKYFFVVTIVYPTSLYFYFKFHKNN